MGARDVSIEVRILNDEDRREWCSADSLNKAWVPRVPEAKLLLSSAYKYAGAPTPFPSSLSSSISLSTRRLDLPFPHIPPVQHRSAPLPRLRAPAASPSPPGIPDLAAARLASTSNSIALSFPLLARVCHAAIGPRPAAMVSGGCVGAEGEVDPEAVAPAAAAEEAVVPTPAREVVVGYALTTKKAKSFLQPKLRGLARKKGILFVAIDQKRPLSDQGPFDIVLHKLTGKGWQQLLEEYREAHPEVTVLDPPGAIANLLDRQSMLQEVSELDLTDCHGKVRVPKQLFVNTDPSSIPAAVRRAGLSLPLVAKPLVAKSHELSLAYDPTSLTKLEPPLVLQEFVNHGGVMFKVYIVGDAIRVVRRFSLPNVDEGDLSNNAGVFRFPRVSCAAASADDADLDPGVAELPPRPLLEILARELRRRLGLRLFNIDMIRQHGTRDRFYVIDMNYFPGYGKMPGYEHVFTDFLLSLAQKEYKRRPSYGSLSSGEG